MSAAAFLGLVGLTLIAGYEVLYYVMCLVLSWAVVLFLIAERLRNLGTYTFADAVSYRLDPRPIRILAASGTLAVTIPYLLIQMVAAGALVEAMFGLSYAQGVLVIGSLMIIYVIFGGMIATTWVQIIKAGLLLLGGSILSFGILAQFNFNPAEMAQRASEIHPEGLDIMKPGILFNDFITVISLTLAFLGGTAGLPHVLMRFFTVPDGIQARRSAAIALTLIAYFLIVVSFVGLGAIIFLVDHPAFSEGGAKLIGGSNMAAIYLSQIIGGDVFLGFMSAVAFATILAVVAGLSLSVAATISHDLYAGVIKKGECTDKEELLVTRVSVLLIGLASIFPALIFEGQNVGILAALPLAIAASANFPVLLLSMYWKGFTTRGALWGGFGGLLLALTLVILGPNVWVEALGFEKPVFPYTYPTLFSMSTGFILAWYFSVTDKSSRAEKEEAFQGQLLRAQFGDLLKEDK